MGKKLKIKVPKKYRLKLTFSLRLLALAVLFYAIWSLGFNFYLLKLLVAKIVALLTNSKVVVDLGDVFIVKGSFNLLIVTDCTGWKEIFVFLSLFLAWPKAKSYARALAGVLAIFAYNIIRLAFLVIYNRSFDYYHPAFQLLSIFIILALWYWSISVKHVRRASRRTSRASSRKNSRRKK